MTDFEREDMELQAVMGDKFVDLTIEYIYLSRFLTWMRQDYTGRRSQTKVTSVRMKS